MAYLSMSETIVITLANSVLSFCLIVISCKAIVLCILDDLLLWFVRRSFSILFSLLLFSFVLNLAGQD